MKSKKIIAALLAFTVLFGNVSVSGTKYSKPVLSVSAAEEDEETPAENVYQGLKYEVEESWDGTKSVTITGYTDEISENLVIPSEIDGGAVKNIKEFAFENCDKITSVTFPDDITWQLAIAYDSFQNCSNLKSITFPEPNRG